jgi:hypothetical protein
MKHIMYAFIMGAILAAGALVAAQPQVLAQTTNNNTSTEQEVTGELIEEGAQGTSNFTEGGNFTIGQEGFGNETTISGLSQPLDTTQLKMHIEEAKTSMQGNDTQAAFNHVILALEEVEMLLGGNATSTAMEGNATSMGNMTATDNSTSNMTMP